MLKKSLALALGLGLSFPTLALADGYWVTASAGVVPPYAQQVGNQNNGAPLFMCRADYRGMLYTGNLNPRFGGCSIAVNGTAVTLGTYQVLVTSYVPGAVVAVAPMVAPGPMIMAAPPVAVMAPAVAVIAAPAPVFYPRAVIVPPPLVFSRNVFYGGHGGGYHHGGHHGGHH